MLSNKFYFDLKKTEIFLALKQGMLPFFRYLSLLKKIFLFLFLLFILLNFLTSLLFSPLIFISLCFALLFWYLELFFESKIKNPKIKFKIEDAIINPENYNLAEFLNFESARVVFLSLRFAKRKRISELNSNILAYFLFKTNPQLKNLFYRLPLALNDLQILFRKEIESLPRTKFENKYSIDFQESILKALEIAARRKKKRIEILHLTSALFYHNKICRKILIDLNLNALDIERLTLWLEISGDKIRENKRFWERKNLLKLGSLAKNWAAGYTILLDQFSSDITKARRKEKFREIFAHQNEVEVMEAILARNEKNNVLIVGESGSSRRSMIEALANRCALGESLPELNYKRVVMLNLPKILVAGGDPNQLERILTSIFEEVVSAGNVILVVDNLHQYVGTSSSKPGSVDISIILSPYLNSASFKFIGITTFEGLHLNIEKKPEFLSFFEKIEVSEISEEETFLILQERALRLEKKYKVIVSWPALKEIISLSSKYLPYLPFPEKAMQLLDEALVFVSRERRKIMVSQDIFKILSQKVQIPLGPIEEEERKILLNLEDLLHQRIIDQEEAVEEVSEALRRARSELSVRKGPIGSFLFLGPTGVGKTETSKALAEIYFGSESRMIRLDMSEFQTVNDIARLIGIGQEKGVLTTAVRENPFSLILLDEFEKAHPDILNLFLQVLDEGHLTDGMGRKVDFKNTLIIATSNAAYQIILKSLEKIGDSENSLKDNFSEFWKEVKKELLDFIFEKGIFRPELINRFDAVVLFKPLNKENLLAISDLLLKKLQKSLAEKDIEFVITLPLKEKIVELGYDITFGARNLQRVIQDKIGNVLASAILANKIKKGDKVEIDPQNFELIINKNE
jgi:ATP-dependent Clp protease ATP-binding subunit ClpC